MLLGYNLQVQLQVQVHYKHNMKTQGMGSISVISPRDWFPPTHSTKTNRKGTRCVLES